eukprot:INCI10392.2.p1 GENE.INCI10392.2~~INCI10392.2.p1  ORF type:complete len:473 (-),score=92.41 INCI10392.2:242-1660(-)
MDLQYSKQLVLDKVENQAGAAIKKARKLLEVFEVCFKNYGVCLEPNSELLKRSSPDYAFVKGKLCAIVSETPDPSSKLVGYLPQGTTVIIAETVGLRARLIRPVVGWCNLRTREGYVVLDVVRQPSRPKQFPAESLHTKLAEALMKSDEASEFQELLDRAMQLPATEADGGGQSARLSSSSKEAKTMFSVNSRDAAGMTLLHYAAVHGRVEAMKLLLAARADPNVRIQLDDVASHGREVMLAYEHERREGNLDAALDGLVDLISHRKRKEQGEMALHLAVHFNQLGAVQCLIQSGSQLRAICNGDATAMDIAIQLKNEPIQQALAQAASMEKALFRATVLQNEPEMRRLLDAKTSVNCTEADGDTPLHVAAGNGHMELVQLLLAAKASMTIADRGGHLPEDDALDEGHEVIYRFLRETRGERVGGSLRAETELDRLRRDVTQKHSSLRNHVALQVMSCVCQLVIVLVLRSLR